MIKLKTKEQIEIMRHGGHLLAVILGKLCKMAKPGVSGGDLEAEALRLIASVGGEPAFKDYPLGGGIYFPTSLCFSINHEVVHGPALSDRVLVSGDIVDLDIGMKWQGLYTDTCKTVAVGKISPAAKKLLLITEKSLMAGIKAAKPGVRIREIGLAIEKVIAPYGYGIVEDLVGHGVGFMAHEDPNIFHYAIDQSDPENIILQPGMVIAIEPMINLGKKDVKVDRNGYTYITTDNSLSAHFEHSIAITEKGNIILTK